MSPTESSNANGAPALRLWRANVLNTLLAVLAVAALPPIGIVVSQAARAPGQWPAALAFLACYLLIVGLAVARRLDAGLRAWGLLLIGYTVGVIAFMRAGLVGDGRTYILALPVITLILVGVRSGLAATVLSLAIYVAFAALASLGWLAPHLVHHDNPVSLEAWADAGGDLAMALIVLVILLWRFNRFQEKILQAERQAADELARTSDLLRAQAQEREETNRALAERTRALAAAADVTRQITSLTDEQELVERFVELIADRFGLYHVGMLLPDDRQEYAVLRAASSQEGQRMAQAGYQVRIGARDPAGQAVQTGQAVMWPVPVTELVPELPQTRWRAALPLQAGSDTLGVVDVHFSSEARPSDELLQILQTLAAQLAVGLQNIRLLAQTRSSLQELTHLYQAVTVEAWQQFVQANPQARCYQAGEAAPAQTWQTLFAEARRQGRAVSVRSQGPDGDQLLAVPVRLRDVPIGVMGFHRPAKTGEWLPAEIALAERVAERAATALDNVRLLEETRRRVARERLLSDVTARMRETLDIDAVLQTALREIGEALGLAEVEVRIKSEVGV